LDDRLLNWGIDMGLRAGLALIFAALLAPVTTSAASLVPLMSFGGNDSAAGINPIGGLIQDAAGNLYGVNNQGGVSRGIIFELSPPTPPTTAWAFKILYSLSWTDGLGPSGNLLLDSNGNLYGTTSGGGAGASGTVFTLHPPSAGGKAWTFASIYSFTGSEGAYPNGSLLLDKAGNLYGTTYGGGNKRCANGCGSVFMLTPPATPQSAWGFNTLFHFDGSNGAHPNGGLVKDGSNNLFGTTLRGGLLNDGTVFKLSPIPGPSETWSMSSLASFKLNDGAYPSGNLVLDQNGNVFGTTSQGGSHNLGTVFRLSASSGVWGLKSLVEFNNSNGSFPGCCLAFDPSGKLYGTTIGGGLNNEGTIFKMTPTSPTKWTLQTLISFSAALGSHPSGNLVVGTAGKLFGTTRAGGAAASGTAYLLTP
jgi:uncharacterized repeat protein (TIGR03803 family)